MNKENDKEQIKKQLHNAFKELRLASGANEIEAEAEAAAEVNDIVGHLDINNPKDIEELDKIKADLPEILSDIKVLLNTITPEQPEAELDESLSNETEKQSPKLWGALIVIVILAIVALVWKLMSSQ